MPRLSNKEELMESKKLDSELRKMIKKANSRINRISKEFGEESWAIKKLKERLSVSEVNAWTKGGRISNRKNYTYKQIIAIESAINKFFNSKTSTVRGIRKVRKNMIEKIIFEVEDYEEITYKEAEVLYEAFEDNSVDYYFKNSNMEPSEFWNLVQASVKNKISKQEFIKEMLLYVSTNESKDIKIRRAINNIYNKYIRR